MLDREPLLLWYKTKNLWQTGSQKKEFLRSKWLWVESQTLCRNPFGTLLSKNVSRTHKKETVLKYTTQNRPTQVKCFCHLHLTCVGLCDYSVLSRSPLICLIIELREINRLWQLHVAVTFIWSQIHCLTQTAHQNASHSPGISHARGRWQINCFLPTNGKIKDSGKFNGDCNI